MQEGVLERIILENQETVYKKKLIPRKYRIPETTNITVITGIRRGGKTYTLYEIAQSFNRENILFLDFEDERLITLNELQDYDVIIDSYKRIFPEKKPILFFDEIQNLNNWHFYLKRLHVAGFKIYVTGSNANLISRDIATFLKGRSLETSIYPFSFQEFLRLKKVEIEQGDYFIHRPKILNLFDEYLQYGGFPEVIKVDRNDKRTVAKNIYHLLFYKDLVAKYDKNDFLLKLIVSKITENITKEFSITSLAKKIMAVHQTTVPTILDYFNILPEPFLTTNIYQYRTSFVQRESKRKTYLADNSFIYLNRVTFDKSRLFENLVFNFLMRKYSNIHYYKTSNRKEVDFYIQDYNVKLLIQASYAIDTKDTKQREISALIKAMDELNLDKGFIYTNNTQDELSISGKTIKIVPFWSVSLKKS